MVPLPSVVSGPSAHSSAPSSTELFGLVVPAKTYALTASGFARIWLGLLPMSASSRLRDIRLSVTGVPGGVLAKFFHADVGPSGLGTAASELVVTASPDARRGPLVLGVTASASSAASAAQVVETADVHLEVVTMTGLDHVVKGQKVVLGSGNGASTCCFTVQQDFWDYGYATGATENWMQNGVEVKPSGTGYVVSPMVNLWAGFSSPHPIDA